MHFGVNVNYGDATVCMSWQEANLGTKVEFKKQLTSVFVPLSYNRTLKNLKQFYNFFFAISAS